MSNSIFDDEADPFYEELECVLFDYEEEDGDLCSEENAVTKIKNNKEQNIEKPRLLEVLMRMEQESGQRTPIDSEDIEDFESRLFCIDKFVIENNKKNSSDKDNLLMLSIKEKRAELFIFLINHMGFYPDLQSKECFLSLINNADFLNLLFDKTTVFEEISFQNIFHNQLNADEDFIKFFPENLQIINILSEKFIKLIHSSNNWYILSENEKNKQCQKMLNWNLSDMQEKYRQVISEYNTYLNSLYQFTEKQVITSAFNKVNTVNKVKRFMDLCSDININTYSKPFLFFFKTILLKEIKHRNEVKEFYLAAPEIFDKVIFLKDDCDNNILHIVAENMNKDNYKNLQFLLNQTVECKKLLNEVNNQTESPVFVTIKNGFSEIIPLFLLYDAEFDITNSKNIKLMNIMNDYDKNMVTNYNYKKLSNATLVNSENVKKERL